MSDLNRNIVAAEKFLELYYLYYRGHDECSPFIDSKVCGAFAGVAVYLQEKLKRDIVISDVISFFMKEPESLLESIEDILKLHEDSFGSTLARNLCYLYTWCDYDDFREKIFESFSNCYAVLPDFSAYTRSDEDTNRAMQSIIDAEEAVLKQPRR